MPDPSSRAFRESAAERALRHNAEAGGARPARPVTVPERRPNLALGRGDVFRPGGKRSPLEVVVSVEWRDPTWAVESIRLASKSHDRLSNVNPNIHFLTVPLPLKSEGRWTGRLHPGAAGSVVPSDGGPTVQGSESPTTTREGTMATVVKRSGGKSATKSGAKGAKSTAKAAKAATPTPTTDAPKRTRRTAEDIAGLVPAFRSHLQGGGTMRQLKEQHGFSDDGPIRTALYRAGFDSKGNEHGETAGSIDATKAAGKKQVVKLRTEQGAGWYRLAFLTGMSESEVKALVTEAGGPAGRVYLAAEKPAKAPRASKAEASATDSADTGGSRKATGKKVTRRAVKADPS
jgi:hypothetical protein